MALTPKKKKFANEYVKCGNQSEAYRRAYDTRNMKPETITEAASKLMKDYDVTTRIDFLQSKADKNTILTAQQLKEELTQYILDQREEECIITVGCGEGSSEACKITKKVQPKDKLKAIEILCKLAGYNAERSDLAAPVTINFNRNYD